MDIQKTLGEFIVDRQHDHPEATGELSAIFASIRLAAKIVHREINKAGLADITGAAGDTNVQGEDQQKLDVFANERFISALAARGVVCGLASEEHAQFVAFEESKNRNGKYTVLIDPLDGSSNIDVCAPVGTIFSLYRRISPLGERVTLEDFLQPGRRQVAAGYVIYGSSTMLIFSTGQGVNGFTYDPSLGVFCLSHPAMQFPTQGSVLSVNQGNLPYLEAPLQRYLAHCHCDDPTHGRPYSTRYIGSLVADFHRNLLQGGIYLYPASVKHPQGKLRLLYECNPLAFLAEQAGGRAIDHCRSAILDIEPQALHQRSAFFVGSQAMIEELKGFL